jgi:hypothetical protein
VQTAGGADAIVGAMQHREFTTTDETWADAPGVALGGELGYWTARRPPSLDGTLGPLLPGLRELADQGAPQATLALAMAEDPHPAVLAQAEQRLAQILAEEPRVWSDGDMGSGSGGNPRTDAAHFALLLPAAPKERLARHLVRLATQGTTDVDPTRADALNGISVLAAQLPDSTRDEMLQPVLALAQDSADSPVDALWESTLHPLSPVSVDLGRRRAGAAVRAAARLARSSEHGQAVLAAASELARRADRSTERAAAHAIAVLLEHGLLKLRSAQILQISTSVPFRQTAVVAWLHSPDPAPEFGDQFVRDPARPVRLTMANALMRLRTMSPRLAEHLHAQLRRDPSARVRQIAAETPSKAA